MDKNSRNYSKADIKNHSKLISTSTEVQSLLDTSIHILFNPTDSFFNDLMFSPDNPVFDFFSCAENMQWELPYFFTYNNKKLESVIEKRKSPELKKYLLEVYAELLFLKDIGKEEFTKEKPGYFDYFPRRIDLGIELIGHQPLSTENQINLSAAACLINLSKYIELQKASYTTRMHDGKQYFILKAESNLRAVQQLIFAHHHITKAVQHAFLDGGKRIIRLKEAHIEKMKQSYKKRSEMPPNRHANFNRFLDQTAELIWKFQISNGEKIIPSHLMANLIFHVYLKINPTATDKLDCDIAYHGDEETTQKRLKNVAEKLCLPVTPRKKGRPPKCQKYKHYSDYEKLYERVIGKINPVT